MSGPDPYIGIIDDKIAPYRTEQAYTHEPPAVNPTLEVPALIPEGHRPAKYPGPVDENGFVLDPYDNASQQRLSRAVEFLSLPFVDPKWRMDSKLVEERISGAIANRQAYAGGSYSTPAMQYPWFACGEANCCSETECNDYQDPCCSNTCQDVTGTNYYCTPQERITNMKAFYNPRLRKLFHNPCLNRLYNLNNEHTVPTCDVPEKEKQTPYPEKTTLTPTSLNTLQMQNDLGPPQLPLNRNPSFPYDGIGPPVDYEQVEALESWIDEDTTHVTRPTRPEQKQCNSKRKKKREKKPNELHRLGHGMKNTVLGIGYDLKHWKDITKEVVGTEHLTVEKKIEFIFCRDGRPVYLAALVIGLLVLIFIIKTLASLQKKCPNKFYSF